MSLSIVHNWARGLTLVTGIINGPPYVNHLFLFTLNFEEERLY